ncbi:MAG: lamin tail domain-containing protein, partial [Verrucomicrobia bacterium]|nr:lamin tail domain-containing protein [Verrucomicrobiota bacterium]
PNPIASNTTVSFTATEFAALDIGGALPSGSAVPAADGLDVSGGGSDIGGALDQFGFSYQRRSGDFDVQVRLLGVSPSDVWAKAGLMARETLAADSRFAAVFASPSLAGSFLAWRDPAGSAAATAGNQPLNYPNQWLRLSRAGNLFTAFVSYDGQFWTPLGSVSIAMPNTVYFGMAVTSHTTSQVSTAQFRSLADVTNALLGPLPPLAFEPLGPSSRKTGLVISEIMYHPAPRADGLSTEFVELFNSQPYPEDISGYRISGDVNFTFPAGTVFPGGAFLVVAHSPSDLQSVYGLANVFGPYTNNLTSKSGTVRLRNRTDAILLEVKYENQPPWPIAADGTGHSLVLARPSLGEGDPQAWTISDAVGGSPGGMDGAGAEPARAVLINEFLAHSEPPDLDFIELYNHGAQPVDLSGYFLTDDPSINKCRIPDGTIIPARGFVSFDETQLGFGLAAGGEQIFFINPTQTRILDAVAFEAQALGVSSGRFPDGAPQFYPLTARTPGTNNSAILIRDVVINEIMYNPISGDDNDQYVELFNRGPTAINLGNWQFTVGITFTFPTNAVISPHGYLVVAKNATRLLANYPNLNATNTVGDFDGALAHSGERLALAMPELVVGTHNGHPVTNLNQVVVDEVNWRKAGRWGQWAAGGGSSLELRDPRANHRLAPNWADSDETRF